MLKYVWDGTVSLWAILIIGSFLVFVAALGFLSTRAYDRATKDYQTSQAYTETQREFHRRCAGLEGDEIFDCLGKQIEAAREPGRSEEDVQAQKEMARWALWMLIVTSFVGFGTIGVTGAGVYWVKETLAETRKAVKAADDAVVVTRDMGEVQTRAYLSVTDFLSEIHPEKISVKITFKNTGQTPARNVRFHIAWASEVAPFQEEWHKPNIDSAEGRGSIGAAMLFYGSVRTDKFKGDPDQSLTADQINRVVHRKEDFWVFGVIEYEDVFDQFHRTRFRYVMNFDTHGDNVAFSPCDAGHEET